MLNLPVLTWPVLAVLQATSNLSVPHAGWESRPAAELGAGPFGGVRLPHVPIRWPPGGELSVGTGGRLLREASQ